MTTTQAPPLSVVYSPAEAARTLRICPSYLYKLRKRGIGEPSVSLGDSGRRLYSREDLEQLAAAIGREAPPLPTPEAA